jgi:hypothetical protein
MTVLSKVNHVIMLLKTLKEKLLKLAYEVGADLRASYKCLTK